MHSAKAVNLAAVRHPSVLDIQVAYDALVHLCLVTFNQDAQLQPLMVALGMGDDDGAIRMLGTVALENYGELLEEAEEGPLFDGFAKAALTDSDARQAIAEAGDPLPDLIGFASEVSLSRNGQDDGERAIMVVLHTGDKVFRSYLPIDAGDEPHAHYAPLQQDLSDSTTEGELSTDLTLANMASSMPALCAQHPLHDIHSHGSVSLH